jgi:hypothetical protein
MMTLYKLKISVGNFILINIKFLLNHRYLFPIGDSTTTKIGGAHLRIDLVSSMVDEFFMFAI